MSDDLRALRELAEAATPGVWDHTSDGSIGDNANWIAYTAGQTDWDIANAAFIAAANPTAVLALLDEVERLRRWKAEATPLFDGMQDLGRALGVPLGTLITGPLAIEAAEALRAKVERVRALADLLAATPPITKPPGFYAEGIRAALDAD